ncbi:hypothetical protein ACFQL1_07210 [Halomicroarcula sp. GCM10025709]|uniref:hypothetical protein n=1 Tax=Haloarcula pelagica TaxID=3033389 RepID=UPI0024C435E2|nr:hypothetical protein [Halomicroarcula sp. YJ-61-S]
MTIEPTDTVIEFAPVSTRVFSHCSLRDRLYNSVFRTAQRLPVDVRYDMYLPLLNTVTSRYPLGTNVYERDWDVLIVLDSCRVDALRTVAPEYDFIGEVESTTSVGSFTGEWLLKTFTERYRQEIAETAYISPSAWTYRIFTERIQTYDTVDTARQHTDIDIDGADFELVKESYRHLYRGWPEWRTVPESAFGRIENVWLYPVREPETRYHPETTQVPHIVTDRAIAVGREHDFDRLVVHYTVPHYPFIGGVDPETELGPHQAHTFPTALRDGETTIDAVWEAYLDNLRLGLDHVRTLIRNIDADNVALTADHGEALGEFGIYKHPYGVPHPRVKRVPWTETTAEDTGTHSPEFEAFDESTIDGNDITENLDALGYL